MFPSTPPPTLSFRNWRWSQFSLVAQSCPTLCNPMNHSTPGLLVHHQLPESTQAPVRRVGDAQSAEHMTLKKQICTQSSNQKLQNGGGRKRGDGAGEVCKANGSICSKAEDKWKWNWTLRSDAMKGKEKQGDQLILEKKKRLMRSKQTPWANLD